jgi:hypothetical protein
MIAPQHPTPDRLFPPSNSDRPFHHPQNPIAYFHIKQRSPIPSNQNNDRYLITHKPDRLFSSNQTAIAPSSPTNPIAYSPKSNSDRSLTTHKTRSPIFPIKQRSPLTTQNPIA